MSTCSYGTIGRTQSCALATHFFWHWPMFSSCCLMCSGHIHSTVGDLQPSLFCLQCQRWTWIDSRRLSHQEHWAIVYQNSQTFKFASGFGRVKTKGLPHKLCKFIRRSFWTKLYPSLPPFFHLPPCTEPRIGLEPRQLASVAWGQKLMAITRATPHSRPTCRVPCVFVWGDEPSYWISQLPIFLEIIWSKVTGFKVLHWLLTAPGSHRFVCWRTWCSNSMTNMPLVKLHRLICICFLISQLTDKWVWIFFINVYRGTWGFQRYRTINANQGVRVVLFAKGWHWIQFKIWIQC